MMIDTTVKNELIETMSDTGLDKNYGISYFLLIKALDLKPLEFLIFTIIYNFNINDLEYTGSVSYLANVLNVSKPAILRSLKSLENKKYIIKILGDCKTSSKYAINFEHIKNTLDQYRNVTSNKTLLVTKCYKPSNETLREPSNETLHNNTIYNTNNKTSSSSKEEKNNNATTATKNDKEKEIQSVLDYYMDNINPSISPIEVERLQEDIKDYSSKWVLEAIKRAVLQGKRKLGYVEAILNSWQVNGYDEIKKADQREPPQDENKENIKDMVEKNSLDNLVKYIEQEEQDNGYAK